MFQKRNYFVSVIDNGLQVLGNRVCRRIGSGKLFVLNSLRKSCHGYFGNHCFRQENLLANSKVKLSVIYF